ncbi:acetyl-CoA carboxylase biotin carboxylase subunit family protein [Kitasatospora sp. NPDC052896]|uniref:acetyl-CoA carboxylase biotin carboxylase subunit family protein n=1 Tax=Kitasatospora sp. NPDC052896 TaxID=3364061 RepID=UPI0037CB6529
MIPHTGATGARTGPTRGDALVVLGGGTFKQERFLQEPLDAGLALLVIDEVGRVPGLVRAAAQPGHPLFGARIAGVDPQDDAGALAAVVAWQEEFRVRGVLLLREQYVTTGGLIAEVLGLPGPGLRAATVCRNKLAQRRLIPFAAPAWVALCPNDAPLAARERLRRLPPGPVVVKALTGSGSVGVELSESPDRALTRVASGEAVLVEEFVAGREVSVETLVVDGGIVFAGITRKEVSQDGQFVERAHTVGPLHDDVPQERLLALHARVIEALRFDTGMAHAEYRIAPDGRIVLMEIAARPGGGGIMSLYTLAGSHPLERSLVAALTGEPTEAPVLGRFARQRYLDHADGTFTTVQRPERVPVRRYQEERRGIRLDAPPSEAPADYRLVFVEKPRGHRLAVVRSSSDRVASVLFDAPTPAELDDLDRRIPDLFVVRAEGGAHS